MLWRRSLRLYESWSLRGEVWYRPLMRAMGRRFARVDCDSPERVTDDALVFGETNPMTLVTLLRLIESLSPDAHKHFVDLGCGRGMTCLVAACLGWQSSGYESESSWLGPAQKVADDLNLAVDFRGGDFLEQDWPTQGVFYVVGTAFEDGLLAEILSRIPPRSHLVACDWLVESDDWKRLWEGPLPVEWGQAYFRVYREQSGSSALSKKDLSPGLDKALERFDDS